MLTLQKNAVFAIRTLQNEDFLHFFLKKFAYIKKKYYLCSEFKTKGNNILHTPD